MQTEQLSIQDVVEANIKYKQIYNSPIPGFNDVVNYLDNRMHPHNVTEKITTLLKLPDVEQYDKYIYILQFIGLIADSNIKEEFIKTMLEKPSFDIKLTNSKKSLDVFSIILANIEHRQDSQDCTAKIIALGLKEKLNSIALIKLFCYGAQNIGFKDMLKYPKFKQLFEKSRDSHPFAFTLLSSNLAIQKLIAAHEIEILANLYNSLKSNTIIDRLLHIHHDIFEKVNSQRLWFWRGLEYVTKLKHQAPIIFNSNNDEIEIQTKDLVLLIELIKSKRPKLYDYIISNRSYQFSETHALHAVACYVEHNNPGNQTQKLPKEVQQEFRNLDLGRDKLKTLRVWTELYGVSGLLAYIQHKDSHNMTWLEVTKQMVDSQEYIKWSTLQQKNYFYSCLHTLLSSSKSENLIKLPDVAYNHDQWKMLGINSVIYELQKDIQPTIELAIYNAYILSNQVQLNTLQNNDLPEFC